jgi:hypothetical protein
MYIKGDYYLLCRRHGELKSRDAVYSKGRANKTGKIRYGCKACKKDYEFSDRRYIYTDAKKNRMKQHRLNNIDKYKINDVKQGKNKILFLKDSYVRKLLHYRNCIPPEEITPELIELKRSIILLKREIKKKGDDQ